MNSNQQSPNVPAAVSRSGVSFGLHIETDLADFSTLQPLLLTLPFRCLGRKAELHL